MTDPRICELSKRLTAIGDADDAVQQKRYHKSRLRFYGVKTKVHRSILKSIFPGRNFPRDEYLPLFDDLWNSDCFDHRTTALWLLERVTKHLTPDDVPMLHRMTQSAEGWATLDTLTTRTLGVMAVKHGSAVYEPVLEWLDDEWLWTRRAAILIHLIPARKEHLNPDYAWQSIEARLDETEFFIRKVIGWVLREMSKHYADDVAEFLLRVGDRASGLTRREGARNLPDKLRIEVLGK